jgi:hypothetical protein
MGGDGEPGVDAADETGLVWWKRESKKPADGGAGEFKTLAYSATNEERG